MQNQFMAVQFCSLQQHMNRDMGPHSLMLMSIIKRVRAAEEAFLFSFTHPSITLSLSHFLFHSSFPSLDS
ncbi:hypothetical protein VNO77_29406 [Canavalia gladiata]|uniref:Uncharacterized protein n=1 Tax=Canavalia gladiata TaxID=3824 RepID=A0AAN9Q7U5_CANGL